MAEGTKAPPELCIAGSAKGNVNVRRQYCENTVVLRKPLKIALGEVRDAGKVEDRRSSCDVK